jgi:beta-galactosidase
MQTLLQRLDPTRPVTYAAPVGDDYEGNINSVIEVRGWNYHVGQDMDNYHREHPTQPEVGTEQGSTVSTRGIYTNDAVRGYVSAYDANAPALVDHGRELVELLRGPSVAVGRFRLDGF